MKGRMKGRLRVASRRRTGSRQPASAVTELSDPGHDGTHRGELAGRAATGARGSITGISIDQ
jgi:hypothetical protein